MRDITEFEKGQIFVSRMAETSVAKTAVLFDFSRATIYRTKTVFMKQGKTSSSLDFQTYRQRPTCIKTHCGKKASAYKRAKVTAFCNVIPKKCNSSIVLDNFNIIDRMNNITDLRILESLHIFKLRPHLNESQSAFPLTIVNR